MRNLHKSVLFAASAMSLSMTAPVQVHAADADASAGVQSIEQVVVTAERREELAQNVPISMVVFNQQELSNHNVIDAQDLALYTPSLSVNDTFGAQNSTFAIRGFVQDIGTAPSVGVFFDDVVAPRAPSQGYIAGDGAGPGDFFDLENVQVLKGPQGTLFGRNTTGGDILLVPKKPTSTFGGYVQGEFGNYDYMGGQAVINIPVNDQIRLRLGVDHESREGYVHNTSGIGPSDFNDVNFTAVRASADIDITPNLEDYIVATFSDSHTNGQFMKMVACDPTAGTLFVGLGACQQLAKQGSDFYDAQQSLSAPYSHLRIWRVINTTSWRVNDNFTIKNIASYAELNDSLNQPVFGTNFSTPAIPGFGIPDSYPFNFAAATSIDGGPFVDQGTYTEELQFLGTSFGDRLEWQGGAYLEGSVPLVPLAGAKDGILLDCPNVMAFQCYDAVGFLLAKFHAVPANTPIGNITYSAGRTDTNDYAIYGQASYKLTDELKLTGGYRYTWDRMANTNRQIQYDVGYPLDLATSQPLPPMVTGKNCAVPSAPGYISPFVNPLGYGTAPLPAKACYVAVRTTSNAPTWQLGLNYTPIDGVLAYAKYARGYRQGVVTLTVPPPFDVSGPEKLDSYEAGVKTSFERGGMTGTFNVSGFYNDFRNQQLLLAFDPNPCYGNQIFGIPGCNIPAPVAPTDAPVNAGKSRIAGMDLEATLQPYPGVMLQVAYTYLSTEILSVDSFSLPSGSLYSIQAQRQAGDPLPMSPENDVSFTGAYTLPIAESFGSITLSATFTHIDSQLSNYADKSYPVPSIAALGMLQPRNLLDLNLNWNQVMGKPFDLSLFATNVTNDKYYTVVSGAAFATGFETAGLGQPTMYGIRLRMHFGDE